MTVILHLRSGGVSWEEEECRDLGRKGVGKKKEGEIAGNRIICEVLNI